MFINGSKIKLHKMVPALKKAWDRGNYLADKNAKSGTKKSVVNLNIMISENEVKSIIKLHIRKKW